LDDIYPDLKFRSFGDWLKTRTVLYDGKSYNPPRGFGLGNLHFLSTIVHIVLSCMQKVFSIECEDDSTKGVVLSKGEEFSPSLIEDVWKVYRDGSFRIKIEKTCVSRIFHFCEMYISKDRYEQHQWAKAQRKIIPLVQTLWSESTYLAKTKFRSWHDQNYLTISPGFCNRFIKNFLQSYHTAEIDHETDLYLPPELGGWYHRMRTTSYNPLFIEIEDDIRVRSFAGKAVNILCDLERNSRILYNKVIPYKEGLLLPSQNCENPYPAQDIRKDLFDLYGPGLLPELFFNALNLRGGYKAKTMKLRRDEKLQAFRVKILRTINEGPLQEFLLEDIIPYLWKHLNRCNLDFCVYSYPKYLFRTEEMLDTSVEGRVTYVEPIYMDATRSTTPLISEDLRKFGEYLERLGDSKDTNLAVLRTKFGYFQPIRSKYPLIEPLARLRLSSPLRWLNPNIMSGLSDLETRLSRKRMKIRHEVGEYYPDFMKLHNFPILEEYAHPYECRYVIDIGIAYKYLTFEEFQRIDTGIRADILSRLTTEDPAITQDAEKSISFEEPSFDETPAWDRTSPDISFEYPDVQSSTSPPSSIDEV